MTKPLVRSKVEVLREQLGLKKSCVEGSAVALLSVVSLMDLDMVRFFVYYIIMLPY